MCLKQYDHPAWSFEVTSAPPGFTVCRKEEVAITNFSKFPLDDDTEMLETNRPARKCQPGGLEIIGGPTALAAGGEGRGFGGDGGGGVGSPDRVKREKQKSSEHDEGEPKGIPAKFLQAISAGLSTSLDPKVQFLSGNG